MTWLKLYCLSLKVIKHMRSKSMATSNKRTLLKRQFCSQTNPPQRNDQKWQVKKRSRELCAPIHFDSNPLKNICFCLQSNSSTTTTNRGKQPVAAALTQKTTKQRVFRLQNSPQSIGVFSTGPFDCIQVQKRLFNPRWFTPTPLDWRRVGNKTYYADYTAAQSSSTI